MLVIFWVHYVYYTCIILEGYTKYKGIYWEKNKMQIFKQCTIFLCLSNNSNLILMIIISVFYSHLLTWKKILC